MGIKRSILKFIGRMAVLGVVSAVTKKITGRGRGDKRGKRS